MATLSGRVAIVTGARTGIGEAIAYQLAQAGVKVIASGRRPGDCDAVVKNIRDAGGTACDHALDLAVKNEIVQRVEAAIAIYGKLDILINNASTILPMSPFNEVDLAEYSQAVEINFIHPSYIIHTVLKHMNNNSGGHIVNLLSGAAVSALEGWSAYCSTKAALYMLTKVIHIEKNNQVKIIGFAPGLVDTGMQSKIREKKINKISDISQSDLMKPEIPAAFCTWLVSGNADDYAGEMVDIRNKEAFNHFEKWKLSNQ